MCSHSPPWASRASPLPCQSSVALVTKGSAHTAFTHSTCRPNRGNRNEPSLLPSPASPSYLPEYQPKAPLLTLGSRYPRLMASGGRKVLGLMVLQFQWAPPLSQPTGQTLFVWLVPGEGVAGTASEGKTSMLGANPRRLMERWLGLSRDGWPRRTE